ncbi:MAG: putative beta-lysine N-acetyltransferase [Desulfuromonadales bacterium]|nr:putative beta-lysine N-acetyltransferase [Desulfuromonadales bacterium]NIS42764.1 putative beta-lysine N-acetyltransferase [Desulfuromonadales bacterium]
MSDRIEDFGSSLIQHGTDNDRVYLMKLAPQDLPGIVESLERFAHLAGYGKIFAKIPGSHKAPFIEGEYRVEATIPGFYGGSEDAVFLGRYLKQERAEEKKPALVREVLDAARAKAGIHDKTPLPQNVVCRPATAEDAEEMAEVYKEVFASYPFPIHDPAYLRQTMDDNVAYFGIWEDGKLIALSSAEMDREGENAEMTDFATLPQCRGRGLAHHLLHIMEEKMPGYGIKTLYTIARAYSHGMNITFAKCGYTYCGTLTHNTQIFGDLESMNIWYKNLA